MSGEKIDETTRDAVLRCVRSRDELDVLLYLAHHRGRFCSPQTIAVEIGLESSHVSRALDALASRNLLAVHIGESVVYRLDPASTDGRRFVERTIEAAWRARAAVLQLLSLSRHATLD